MTLWSLCAFAASTVRFSVLRFSLTLPWLIRPRTRIRSSKPCKQRTPLHRTRLLHADSAATPLLHADSAAILHLHVDFATTLQVSALQSSHGTVSIRTVKHFPCIDVLRAALIVASDTFAIGHATTATRATANVDLIHAGIGDAPKFAQS